MAPTLAASLLFLASLALATPLVRRQDAPWITTDLPQICDHDDLGNYEVAQEIWDRSNAGHFVDTYITQVQNGNADKWMNEMWTWTFGGNHGPSPMDSCASFTSGCSVVLDCEAFFNKSRAGYYWPMKAVQLLHEKFDSIHEKLQDITIVNTLRVKDIAKDFSEPPVSMKWASYLSASFVVGAGAVSSIAGANPAIGGLATVLVGIFSGLAAGTPPGHNVDPDALQDTLVKLFQSVNAKLEDTMILAVGNVPGGDYASLPNYGVSKWKTPVANFLSGGNFLVSNTATEYREAVKHGFQNLNDKILDVALQTADVKVMANYRQPKKGNPCSNKGDRWLADIDGGRCFHLVRFSGADNPGGNCGKPDNKCRPEAFSDEDYDLLDNKYHFDLERYYRAAYACAASESKDFDEKNLPIDGTFPTCFFNPRTFKGQMEGKILQKWENFAVTK